MTFRKSRIRALEQKLSDKIAVPPLKIRVEHRRISKKETVEVEQMQP